MSEEYYRSHLCLVRGIPGSGKSHWVKRFLRSIEAAHGTGYVVSRDGYRAMLKNADVVDRECEGYITKLHHHAIRELLTAGELVIVDDTNLRRRQVRELLGIAEQLGATWEVKDFTAVPLEVCLKNNANRERQVPEEVIRRMHQKYIAGGNPVPEKWEPLGLSEHVEGEPYVAGPTTTDAIIVDIDGTLALRTTRGPFQFGMVGTDAVNEAVLDYVRAIQVHQFVDVILVSGRPEHCRKATEEWLERNRITYDELFMRSHEEHEEQVRDDKVKLRIFNEHIRHNYNVHSVIDDRSRVVAMWRSLGLTVMQCAPGEF